MVDGGIDRSAVGGVIAKAADAGLIRTGGGIDGSTELTDLGRSELAKLLA